MHAKHRFALAAAVLAAAAPAGAVELDSSGDITLGVRTYVNSRIGTENTDRDVSYVRNANGDLVLNSEGYPIPAQRSQTFPYSSAGHLRQNRFFIEAELRHDLDRLVEKGVGPFSLIRRLPVRVRNLRYGVTYRGEFDGIYDWGPSEYRNAWTADQFLTSQGDSLPVNPSNPGVPPGAPICSTFPSDDRCRRIVDVPEGRRELRDDAVHRSRLFQAYVDAEVGSNFWFRFGRQIVAWGETDSFRLLDNINPTDSSFGGFLVPLDERRVPLDMLRVQYRLGEIGPLYEIFLEGYVAIDDRVGYDPGVPKGSPWALPNGGEPSPLSLTLIESPSRTFEDARGGGRLVFNAGDATYSIAHYYTYLDRPVVQVFTNPEGGFPTKTWPDGYSTHYLLTPERTQITGATTTFPIPMNVARFLRLSGQPIVRSEFAYFNDEPRYRQSEIDPFVVYRSPGKPTYGRRRVGDSLNLVLGLDLNQFIRPLNPIQSFFISTQFFYKHLIGAAESGPLDFGRFRVEEREVLPVPQYFTQGFGLDSNYATEPVFVREPEDQFLQTLLISTSYMSSQVNPQLTMFYDWGGAFVLQPAVTLVYDPFRITLDYTFVNAGTLKGGSSVSLLRDRDNVQIRFEYVI